MPGLPRSPLFGRRGSRAAAPVGAPEPQQPRVEIVEAPGLRWINIERPRPVDQAWLEERFEFHPLDYEDVFSRNQRPKVDEYDEYLFIVLQFPRYDREESRLRAVEVDIFLGPDYLITLVEGELDPLDALFEQCRDDEAVRNAHFGKGPGYLLYRALDRCVDAGFPMLRKIGAKLERLEDDIFEGRSGQIVRQISNTKQEIINFRRVVRPQLVALRDLEAAMEREGGADLDVYFDDMIDASERIWDLLENYKEVAEGLEDTNESVLSHRVNDVLRVLTAFSAIFLPLTLLASIFGMNVRVPGEGGMEGFWVVVASMVAMLGGMLGYFRYRGWL